MRDSAPRRRGHGARQLERDLAPDAARRAGDEHDRAGKDGDEAAGTVPTMPRWARRSERGRGFECIGGPGPRLRERIAHAIAEAGGWLPFDRFMALALYAPGLGYYARDDRQFGLMPATGSDFVTAPELSPLFGTALAAQVAQALYASGTDTVWEFGAGSGALAAQLLDALGERVRSYRIVELSGSLRERQRERLARFGDRVHWLDALPDAMHGVVVGNEVLDAMPVQLLRWDGRAGSSAASLPRQMASPGRIVRRRSRRRSRRRWTPRRAALRSRLRHRDPSAGRGLRRHAGRAADRAAPPSSSTTVSPTPSTTTRSAAAAR